MERQKTDQEILQESAENAVFLVEGWQNLGDIEGKKTYRGQVGPWRIMIRSDGQHGSESCRVEATAFEEDSKLTVTFSPHFARVALRRACFDETQRVLFTDFPELKTKAKRRRRKANGACR